MFARLFRRNIEADATASAIYGAIVAQARHPALYADLGVADTVDGRFEMVVLHTILVLDRLQAGGEAEKAVGQKVFDLYCTDMDRSLREMGIGDLGVPKRMKRMTEAFYGRAAAYRAALAAANRSALAEVIERNVFRGAAPASMAASLAAYVLASAKGLAGTPGLAVPLAFADPATFASAGVAA